MLGVDLREGCSKYKLATIIVVILTIDLEIIVSSFIYNIYNSITVA